MCVYQIDTVGALVTCRINLRCYPKDIWIAGPLSRKLHEEFFNWFSKIISSQQFPSLVLEDEPVFHKSQMPDFWITLNKNISLKSHLLSFVLQHKKIIIKWNEIKVWIKTLSQSGRLRRHRGDKDTHTAYSSLTFPATAPGCAVLVGNK